MRREADVLLLCEEENSEILALLVEAKHESGLHNLERDTEGEAEEGFASSGHQLADECAALSSPVWHLPDEAMQAFQQARRRLLLYVTAHYELPRADLEEAVRVAGAGQGGGVAGPQPATDLYWVGWRDLHTLLVNAGAAGFPGYSLGERNFLEDLREVLALRRLCDFQPFLGLKPVAAYERVVQQPLRFERLKLVEPYLSIFGTR